jgi:hypothetical protein
MLKDNHRWLELCDLVANEKDPEKMAQLIAELNRALDADRVKVIQTPSKKGA